MVNWMRDLNMWVCVQSSSEIFVQYRIEALLGWGSDTLLCLSNYIYFNYEKIIWLLRQNVYNGCLNDNRTLASWGISNWIKVNYRTKSVDMSCDDVLIKIEWSLACVHLLKSLTIVTVIPLSVATHTGPSNRLPVVIPGWSSGIIFQYSCNFLLVCSDYYGRQ